MNGKALASSVVLGIASLFELILGFVIMGWAFIVIGLIGLIMMIVIWALAPSHKAVGGVMSLCLIGGIANLATIILGIIGANLASESGYGDITIIYVFLIIFGFAGLIFGIAGFVSRDLGSPSNHYEPYSQPNYQPPYSPYVQPQPTYVQPEPKKTAPESNTASELDSIKTLRAYKELLDAGAITQEEFDAKKKELLK